jgi:hypothetical protein
MHCPVGWAAGGGSNLAEVPQAPQVVTMKGGECYFMPSPLSWPPSEDARQ